MAHSKIVDILARTAKRWSDPDYGVREDAIERTLEADNRFTEAAVVFAINQQMALLTSEALTDWEGELKSGRSHSEMQTVAVLNPGNIPFVELQDLVAVLLAGHAYVGTVSSRSPALLPAFISDLMDEDDNVEADLTDWKDALDQADMVIASGSDETMATVKAAIQTAGISEEACWLRGHRYSVAVLSGHESDEDLVDLAEDVLLHEGQGCRNVNLVFAPESMEIDPVLDAFAHFRGMFAAHDRTRGPLKMQQALLKAVDAPHAWAEGHEFLISRGEAEPQGACHLRWVSYSDRSEAEEWIRLHANELQSVFTRISSEVEPALVAPLGSAQRPDLTWCPDRRCHVDFFRN
jgi:hypothetical protein